MGLSIAVDIKVFGQGFNSWYGWFFKNILLHKRDLIVTAMQGIEHYTHIIIFTDVLRVGIILEYTWKSTC